MKRGSPVRKLPARKLLVSIVAGALFLPNTAFTLGLGEIEVNSGLNQKLKADIELLSATPEDAEDLIVKLASRKEFSRAGLDRPYLLNDLRFKSEVIDGVPHINVSSASPIREPFLNFLVEIDWPNGHLIREYTVLLDPPVFMTQQASAAPAPTGQSNNASFRPSSGGSTNVVPVVTAGVSTSPRPGSTGVAPSSQTAPQATSQASSPAFVPAPYVSQQTSANQPAGSYRIKAGDTAWSLANAMMPDQSITVEQMMIAMLRANPESFIDENINGLKRGYILRVPDYDQIVSINQDDARALVREQAALWRQYQQTHTGGQPASAMSTDEMSGAGYTDNGAVTTGEEDAYLEIVSAGAGSSSMSSKDPTDMTPRELRAELALARERVETERVEKEALQQRVESLEQNVGKMKGMLSIEDDQLSDMQALGTPAGSEPSEGEMLESDIVQDAEAEMEESIAETDDMLAEQNLDDAITEEVTEEEVEASDDMVEQSTEAEAVFLDESSADGEPTEMAESTETMPEETAAEEAVQPQIISRPPADPLSKLLSDPILLAAAGGGLLLILAVIGLIIKRRKAATETESASFEQDSFDSLAEDIAAETAEDKVEAGPLAGGEADVDADADKTAIEDFASDSTMILDAAEDTIIAEENPAAALEEDEPRDDVIAEADVYLAYGIYQQAEELLTQAITDNPDRDDYRVKLAETHYASKNAEAFVEVATELKNRTADDANPAWKKVMVMGQDLCADNELFQGSMIGGLDVDSLAPKAPEMDFDLGIDAAPDFDLNLDEASAEQSDDQPLELPEMDDSSDEGQTSEDQASAVPTGEIEFDLSDTGAIDEAPVEDDEFSLDIDASELDIDIKEEAEEASVTDESDEILDVGDIDIDFGLDEVESADDGGADEEIALDLTEDVDSLDLDMDLGMDIELDTADSDDTAAVEEAAPVSEPEAESGPEALNDFAEEEDFDLSSLDDVDEVSTKLDLARAYLDMGDHEGTRGILEEVIAEGNDEQKQEANELMAKLD